MTELLEVFVHGLEMIRDLRLGGFLGDTEKADKPKQAMFWRSGKTTVALNGNMDGLKTLFEARHRAGAAGGVALDCRVDRISSSAMRSTPPKRRSGRSTMCWPTRKTRQLSLFRRCDLDLSEIFGIRLAAALGLTAGFSSLDGD